MLKFQWKWALTYDMMDLRSERNVLDLRFKKKGGCYLMGIKKFLKELSEEFEKMNYIRNRIIHPEYQQREVFVEK